MNSLTTFGSNQKLFRIGGQEFCYRYRIPVQTNRGANYNSGYIEGYQRALRDFERASNKLLNQYKINSSFYN